MSAAENDSLGSCQKEDNDAPPPVSIKLPKSSELSNKSKQWSNDHLPVDIVLLTVEECEFLACYAYMGNPIRRYHSDLGYVYFGTIGDDDDDDDDDDDNDNNQLKVALLKCFAGSSGPGAAQVVANDAVRILRPRAIFSVGYCEGLKPEKTRLGDVVVSSKLTFEDLKTPVGKSISHLIKHSGDGWKPPLERPDDAHQVKVRDGEILSCKDKETAKQLQSGAIAREMEGQGVFVAAHNLKMEWVIVKGISHFADSNKIPEESWKSHACVMAASLVFNMLNDTVVFKQWPHYKDLSAEEESSASQLKRDLPCSSSRKRKQGKISDLSAEEESSSSQLKKDLPCSSPRRRKRRMIEVFPLEKCQERLKSKYYVMSRVTITPWDPNSAVHIDTIYTRLSWFKDDVTPRGVMKKKLEDYTEIFTSQEHPNLKRILVYGRPGIGKSTFCKKAAYDWSQQSNPVLRKFDLVLLIKLRDVCNRHNVADILKASELLASDSSISVDSLYGYIKDEKNNVLLLLDGYDEYSYDDMRESPVRRIWDSKELSDCTVVLTMRPTRELKSIPLQFEINGFDDEKQVKMFSLKVLKDDSDVKEFYEYLKEHNLTEIAEIPLLLRMLCLLWTETDPSTRNLTSRANIYTLFTRTMLSHLSEKEDTVPCKIKKVDEYAEELSKLGKLAYDALLKGNVTLLKSELTDDLQIIINKFTEVGLCHAFKPSRVNPMEGISFIHKSIQEYIAGTYLKEQAAISRNDENATFLSELDSIEKVLKMKEVLKFASELSGCSACAILNHLGEVAEEDGLTDIQKSLAMEKTPSLEVVEDEDFLMLTVDIFLCCSAETRQNLFPTLLSYIGSVLLINSDQLHSIANEHLLKSTEPPNVIFFHDELTKPPERDYRDLVSVMDDLNAVVVSSSGVKNASEFLNKYPFRPIQDFFLKKEENIMYLYFAKLRDYDEEYIKIHSGSTNNVPYPTEMLKELIASPESTAQQRKESDTHQSSEQNTRTTVCSTQDTDSTSFPTHHCLSLAWHINVLDSFDEDEMRVVTEVVPFVIAPRNVFIDTNSDVFKYWNINFTDKLDTLGLSLSFRDDIAAFATLLRQSPNLDSLMLGNSPLGKGLSVLTSLLSCVPNLTNLYLQNVMMTKQQVHDLTTAVHQNKISQLLSNYHDLKGNPLPEDKWPSEDFWKDTPWLVPSESEDESGSSAESEDESVSSAESEDEPGSSAESKDEPGSSAESEDESGSSAESEDEPGSSAESKDEPGS